MEGIDLKVWRDGPAGRTEMTKMVKVVDEEQVFLFPPDGEGEDLPVSDWVWRHWEKQRPATLRAARILVIRAGGDPWVFAGDRHCFEQYCSVEDIAALQSLSDEQARALLTWDRDDLWYD